MRRFQVFLAIFSTLAFSVLARCAPRTITIQYKAESAVPISVRRNCRLCLTFGILVKSFCTKIACRPGERCNTCTAVLRASDLPAGQSAKASYSIFMNERCPLYTFSADWPASDSDWFERNGWIVGCESRVAALPAGVAERNR